jgi:hypothetical protein
MRALFLVLTFALTTPAIHAQDTDAEAVVKRAIDAAGGSAVLAKFPAGKLAATGTLFPDDKTKLPVTAEQVFDLPGKSRTTMRMQVKGQKLEVLQIVNGPKARYAINGSPVPISEPAAKELHAAMLTLEIGQLTPLLLDRKFLLKLERTLKTDADTANLLVSVKNNGEYHLGFDRTTGHLVRLARKAFEPSAGKDVDQEQVFSDFKLFNGLVRPTKVVLNQNGKKVLELTTESLTPLEKTDGKDFATE